MEWILLAVTVASFAYTWLEMGHKLRRESALDASAVIPEMFGERMAESDRTLWLAPAKANESVAWECSLCHELGTAPSGESGLAAAEVEHCLGGCSGSLMASG